MRTLILLDHSGLQRWHAWLISTLTQHGETVVHVSGTPGAAVPAPLKALLAAEKALGRGRASSCDPIGIEDLGAPAHRGGVPPAGDFAVVLDLTGNLPSSVSSGLAVAPLFDGVPGQAGLWSALLAWRSPVIGLAIAGRETRIVAAPAIAHPHQIREAADHVLSRVAQALVTIATRGVDRLPAAPSGSSSLAMPGSSSGLSQVIGFGWAKVADKATRALARRRGTEPRWRVGWRLTDAARDHLAPLPPLAAYTVLKDDGARYFADPFVWQHDGVHHVFVEELPYATGRGLISHFTISADGTAGAVTPVMESKHHLSYPQIFTHGGEIYMMPECSESGTLDLYRADPFPSRWTPAFRLLDREVHDATLVAHEGRFYILASEREFASSTFDALHIYSADKLEGPWEPLPGNPVLVDGRSGRSAGGLYWTAGALWRPAQDCTRGYGSALTIARVDRLGRDGFAQTSVDRLLLTNAAAGPHTVNVTGRLEVLDFLA